MNHTILFLCPHGAAKSVLAATYFRRLATQRGLVVQTDSAGTEPDANVSPSVVNMLRAEGIDVADYKPRHVTAAELATALRVVSLGCDVTELAPANNVMRWDDVPPVSQNAPAARDAIRAHVERLVDELARTLPKETP